MDGGKEIDGDEALAEVYDELRRLAGAYLARERPDHTLQPTALVHEAYLRLVAQTRAPWKSAGHLRAVAAQAMRRILIDHARRRHAEKRGSGAERVTLCSSVLMGDDRAIDVLALEEALGKLTARDERQAKIVELHLFGGLSHREVAEVLELSITTVEDGWRFARAWLGRELGDGAPSV